jgi:hypothetical protein
MAWQTPKTNWGAADVPLPDDFNRIEGNVQELQNTKETPAGAQAKAEAAETNAKNHANGLVGTLGNLLTVAKNNAVAAINELVNTLSDFPEIPTVVNSLTSTSTTSALSAAQGKILNDTKATYNAGTASIPTTWSASPNGQGYYTRTVTVPGLVSSDNIDITCVKSASDSAAGKLIQEAWNLIDMVEITTNTLTFYAFEKPAVAIPIAWKRVR